MDGKNWIDSYIAVELSDEKLTLCFNMERMLKGRKYTESILIAGFYFLCNFLRKKEISGTKIA